MTRQFTIGRTVQGTEHVRGPSRGRSRTSLGEDQNGNICESKRIKRR